jgi:DNA-binding beta-propeller fold protein YncE
MFVASPITDGTAPPAGWMLPVIPPMVLQLLVGRFVKHIGCTMTQLRATLLPPTPHAAAALSSTLAIPPPMDFEITLFRGKSSHYWEDDGRSSTRASTPDDTQYVQDPESNAVVRQTSAAFLQGGAPIIITPELEAISTLSANHAVASYCAQATTTRAVSPMSASWAQTAAAAGLECAEFREPTGLTCLPDGNLAVCSDETRVTIINQLGYVVRRLTGIGGLRFPRGLTALGGQMLAIADGLNHRVLIVDSETKRVVRELGRNAEQGGDGIDELNSPAGMSVIAGAPDLLAICDQGNNRVKIVNWRTGRTMGHVGAGRRGHGEDEFNRPWGIASLAVEDCYEDPNEAQWLKASAVTTRATMMATTAAPSSPPPPVPVAVLVVCDQDNNRLKLITTDGVFIRHIGDAPNGGSGRDAFSRPRGVVALDGGVLCVTDIGNHRVKVVSAKTGAYIREFNASSVSCMAALLPRAEVWFPLGIAVLPGGDIAVGDRDNHRITVLRP